MTDDGYPTCPTCGIALPERPPNEIRRNPVAGLAWIIFLIWGATIFALGAVAAWGLLP